MKKSKFTRDLWSKHGCYLELQLFRLVLLWEPGIALSLSGRTWMRMASWSQWRRGGRGMFDETGTSDQSGSIAPGTSSDKVNWKRTQQFLLVLLSLQANLSNPPGKPLTPLRHDQPKSLFSRQGMSWRRPTCLRTSDWRLEKGKPIGEWVFTVDV